MTGERVHPSSRPMLIRADGNYEAVDAWLLLNLQHATSVLRLDLWGSPFIVRTNGGHHIL